MIKKYSFRIGRDGLSTTKYKMYYRIVEEKFKTDPKVVFGSSIYIPVSTEYYFPNLSVGGYIRILPRITSGLLNFLPYADSGHKIGSMSSFTGHDGVRSNDLRLDEEHDNPERIITTDWQTFLEWVINWPDTDKASGDLDKAVKHLGLRL